MSVSSADSQFAAERMAKSGTGSVTQDRPANGSERGKRLFILYALITARPKITPREVKDLTGWDDQVVATASADLELLLDESQGVQPI